MSSKVYSVAPTAERNTRDCLDPWFFTMIQSDGGVRPCCNRPPFARLTASASLAEILDHPAQRELRQQLLDGRMDELCTNCPSKPLTDVSALRLRVRVELARVAQDSVPAESTAKPATRLDD